MEGITIFHPSKRSNKVSETTPFVFLAPCMLAYNGGKEDKRCYAVTYCGVMLGSASAASGGERQA